MNNHELRNHLLDAPCWVIDALPENAPDACRDMDFSSASGAAHPLPVRRRFLHIVQKLSCSFDLELTRADQEICIPNPVPETLDTWISDEGSSLSILFPSQQSLITLSRGEEHINVYDPSAMLLIFLRHLLPAQQLQIRKQTQRKEEKREGEKTWRKSV